MSRLIFVRHAQASFLTDDYDRLSETGCQQAAALGRYWVGRERQFSAVVTGPRRRHQQTAALVGRQYREAGLCWPEPVVVPELDEHGIDQFLIWAGDALQGRFPELRDRRAAFENAVSGTEKHRAFQKLFESVVVLWASDAVADPDLESWARFSARVTRALDRLTPSDRRGMETVVFTSVGPISVVLHRVLACRRQTALELGWRLWNCSLTELVYSRHRMTLDCFNALPHLNADGLLTYR